jgi:hypothetical protein
MTIAPGDDITGTPEPLPRDSLTNRLGGLARGWINYFQGKDRLTGEILSGVNRNRQNIVQLQTDYTAADGAVSSAYIAADAVVAADASGAQATLSTTLTAAYEAADSTIQGQVTTNAASIVTEQSVRASGDAANASSITTLEAAYEAADSTIQGQVTTNAASIVTEESARASGDSANASSITTLTAKVTGLVQPERVSVVEDFGGSSVTPGGPLTLGTNVDVSGEGTVRQFAALNSAVVNSESLPISKGRTYRVESRARVTADGTGNVIFAGFAAYNSSGTHIGFVSYGSLGAFVVADGWRAAVQTVTYDAVLTAYPTAVSIRGFFWSGRTAANTNSGATWQIAYLRLGTDTEAQVATIAEAYATDSSATARLVWTVNTTTNAATIEQTAAEGYADGTWNGSAINLAADQITLLAEDINFGSQTSFDTASETFITEVGSIRSRYGTAFGASSNLIRWDGPVAVTQGSETPTNGYLAITTAGVTYHNTAALNWGATAAEAAASNAQVQIGRNQIVDYDFRFGDSFWRKGGQSGSTTTGLGTTATGFRYRSTVGSGITVGHFVYLDNYPDRKRLACIPGDVVEWSFYSTQSNCSVVWAFIQFFNSAGTGVGYSAFPTFTPGAYGDGLISWTRCFVVATAPANAAYAMANCRAYASTSSPVFRVAKPMLALANLDQTGPSPWNPGFDSAPGADVTGDNTASAIDGQGLLALGNFYEQASDPGSVPNGSFWSKTGSKELFIRSASTWKKVANIGADLSISLSPTSFVGFASSTSCTATGAGGSGGYTYAWTKVSGDTLTVSAPSSASTNFTRATDSDYSSIYRCTVTDSLSATAYQDFTINLLSYS